MAHGRISLLDSVQQSAQLSQHAGVLIQDALRKPKPPIDRGRDATAHDSSGISTSSSWLMQRRMAASWSLAYVGHFRRNAAEQIIGSCCGAEDQEKLTEDPEQPGCAPTKRCGN